MRTGQRDQFHNLYLLVATRNPFVIRIRSSISGNTNTHTLHNDNIFHCILKRNGENETENVAKNHVQNEIGMKKCRTEHKIKLDFVIAIYGCMSCFSALSTMSYKCEFVANGNVDSL